MPSDFIIDTLPGRAALAVRFPYDEAALNFIRAIPGRQWHSEEKFWSIPLAALRMFREAAARRGFGVALSERVREALQIGDQHRRELLAVKADTRPLDLPTATEVRPFQYAGIRFCEHALRTFHGALLADDMGLGKTLQALSVVAGHDRLRNVSVFCPATLKYTWAAEIEKHYPVLDYIVIDGPPRVRQEQWTDPARIKIANYELLLRDVTPRVMNWDMVIFDEATMLKSYKAQRTQRSRRLKRRYTLALSGIPLENRLEELYQIIELVMPGLLGPWVVFDAQHIIRDRFGSVRGYRGIEQIRDKISPYMIRRRKSEVLRELPEKVYSEVMLELGPEERRVYNAVAAQIRDAIHDNPKLKVANILTMLLRLKQATNDIRLLGEEGVARGTKIDSLAELLEEAGEHRIVAFTQFAQMADLVAEEFGAPIIKGDVPPAERARIIETFQQGGQPLLVSTEAGAYGITLTAADIVVHLDLPWNPARMRQREDRLHRMGQARSVQVVTMLARHTIDERIRRLLHSKQTLINAVLDEKAPDEESVTLTRQEVLALLGDD